MARGTRERFRQWEERVPAVRRIIPTLAAWAEALVWSADLDRAHLNRYRKAVCNDIAADLLGALLEAGL